MRPGRSRRFLPLALLGAVSLTLASGTDVETPHRCSTCVDGGETGSPSASGAIGGGSGRWKEEIRTQSIAIDVSEEGLRVRGTPAGRLPWEWGLSLTRYGGPNDLRAADPPFLMAGEDRVELQRRALAESYRNGSAGIEHGLEVWESGETPLLWFDFTLSGNLSPKVSEDGRSVVFRDPSGAPSLIYLDLSARDAAGREVAVRWERLEPARRDHPLLRLVLDGTDHAFPLAVQGRLSTPKAARRALSAAAPESIATIASAPVNDLCTGAEIVPGAGPFPYVTSAVDVTEATTASDPPSPSCQGNVSRSVWFEFTPSESAAYDFSVCSDAPTSTTVEDTVLAVYEAGGPCTGLTEVSGGCNDDWCGPSALQSSVTGLRLTGGTLYYIVAWSFGTTAPLPGSSTLQLQVSRRAPTGPAPPNDLCAGAETIPDAGPFPYLTSITSDIGGATTAGDPPPPSCQSNVSRSVWYSFTPSADGRYAFSLCADSPTGTTVDDTVLAVYKSSAVCSGLSEISGGCNDDSCFAEAAQSVISGVNLANGTTYYVVVWEYGAADPAAGNTAVQLRVSQVASPPNDTCAGAETLNLDRPVNGTTVDASDDVRLPSDPNCFSGVGQTPSTASGGDVTYRFTAPEDGAYSFRLSGYDPSKNAVLHVSSDCPSGSPPETVAACLGAANRTVTSAEEVDCLPLASGQTVYVHVDEDALSGGSDFALEANRCAIEPEPNGSPVQAAEPACGMEGSIAPAGDVDFFALGIPAAGSRLFAQVDGAAGNSNDFDLRLTTDVDTLEYDDFNNDTPFGAVAPNLSGTPLTGVPAYLRVNHYSPAAEAEPYRIYASIRPPAAAATPEIEPNDTIPTATSAPGEYYAGSLSGAGDVDLFAFTAVTGDLVQIGLDLDPTRDRTPFNGSLALLDDSGTTLLLVNDPSANSSTATGVGSLSASTPFSPGEALVYRPRRTGTYYARVGYSSGTPGDYLVSVSHGCRVNPPADLSVAQSGGPDPVAPGGNVTYTIVATNLGPGPASAVALRVDLPAGAEIVSATADHGVCQGAGPVVCYPGDLADGASVSVSVVISAPLAPGLLTNVVRISSANVDPSASNDVDTVTTMVSGADGDGDGVADADDCAPADPSAWAVPGDATGLAFSASGSSDLYWSPPAQPGGSTLLYDLLRSPLADGFMSPACPSAGTSATSGTDATSPGLIFYYLVRARNACGGNAGTRSDGTPRVAGPCP